jgi:hypothetical protein
MNRKQRRIGRRNRGERKRKQRGTGTGNRGG